MTPPTDSDGTDDSARLIGPPPIAEGTAAREPDILLRATLALFVIGMAVWLVFAATGYRQRHVSANECWQRGSKTFIELTLVREDRGNLACASNAVLGDLHCAFGEDRRAHAGPHAGEPHTLRPYNTTGGQLLLGAGLWSSPRMPADLPAGRFTAWCDFEVVGAIKSASLRWTANGDFAPAGKALPAGSLHDCAIPE